MESAVAAGMSDSKMISYRSLVVTEGRQMSRDEERKVMRLWNIFKDTPWRQCAMQECSKIKPTTHIRLAMQSRLTQRLVMHVISSLITSPTTPSETHPPTQS